jgi:hypothetical protein
MSEMKVNSTTVGDMTNRVQNIEVSAMNTDGSGDQKETEWTNSKWSTYFGYYKQIPEVKTAIDMRAIWTLGKGYKADPETTVILDHITGWGMDSFNSILKNMIVTRRIGGDSFSEIIRDEESGTIINIKPLDPSTIKTIVNQKGIIIRYEQMSKIQGVPPKVFRPKDIFHLTNKRVADEIHGVSDIEAIEDIIKANYESFKIQKDVIKNFSRPKLMVAMDTDEQSKINTFVEKFDDATNKGDNLFFPKGTVEPSVLAVPANSTLNINAWRDHLRNYFFQVVGIPQIILGSSGEFTESTAKIAYLAFQQSVEDEQLDIEEQVWNQLFLRIELSFPASLQNELISDKQKDGANQQMDFQASDMMAGVGR